MEDKSFVTSHADQMGTALKSFSVIPTYPMSFKMRERGKLTLEAFEELVGVLSIAGADGTASLATSPEHNEEAATTSTLHRPRGPDHP